jgi:hypothetical protein
VNAVVCSKKKKSDKNAGKKTKKGLDRADIVRDFRLRDYSDGMRRPVSAGCDTLPMFDVLKAQ